MVVMKKKDMFSEIAKKFACENQYWHSVVIENFVLPIVQ